MKILKEKEGQLTMAICPYCGKRDLSLHEPTGEFFVYCRECGAQGPTATSETTALTQWNLRLSRKTSHEGWIAIEDRKPEDIFNDEELKSINFLIAIKSEVVMQARYSHKVWIVMGSVFSVDEAITHWRIFPASPSKC